MNKHKQSVGVCIAVMAAALIVGGTLAYSSASGQVGTPGGIAGNGANGGFIHTNGTSKNVNGANGSNANGIGFER